MLKEILELTELAYKVHEEMEHDVSVDISSHIHLLEIRVYYGGWRRHMRPTWQGSFYWNNAFGDSWSKYDEIKEKLNDLLLGGK